MVREYTLYDSYDLNPFKFLNTCFMAQNIIYLGLCSICTCSESELCCYWVESSIDVSWVKFVSSVIQVFIILAYFWCSFYLLLRERCWNLIVYLSTFPCSLLAFASCISEHKLLGLLCPLDELIYLSFIIISHPSYLLWNYCLILIGIP